MVTVTNMILTKILLAYHISRTAPRRQRSANPLPPPRTDTNGPEHTGHCKHSSEPLAMPSSFGTKGFMPKLGKTAFVVFLNYSKNKTSR